MASSSVLVRSHVAPSSNAAGYQADFDVVVRRQNTSEENVKLLDEFDSFTKTHFPNFQTKFIQLPEVFASKVKDPSKAIEGFAEKKRKTDVDPVWLTHALGDKAESDLFQALEKEFVGRPSVSWNGFEMRKLFLVAKETLKEKRNQQKLLNPTLLEVPLTNGELELYRALGHDVKHLTDTVEDVMKNLFGTAYSLKTNIQHYLARKLNKDVEVVCKDLLRKVSTTNPSPDQKETENYICYKLWKKVTDENQEFDQFLLDKGSSTFAHFEVKAVERFKDKYNDTGLKKEYYKACAQLELGKKMFHEVIAPTCGLSVNWAYQGKSS